MPERTTEDDGGAGQIGAGTEVVYSSADDRAEGTDLSVAVIESLAEAKGVTPIDIQQPLYDVVDPDALDRLFTDGEGSVSGRVVFEFDAHEITVHSDGDILVRRVDPS
ncbi:HalOD1 output domain-containing protein [Halosimplex aquaticum]|uniref:HalOD1 output domain-containing protein n=1 Tax=Halosimplex aquaticum TaxID=3026162 RepID=A0ABD5Y3T2_9EURY|nr:HalOD1 output domain-containing protein [Halosimplex aquaticum]